jgi:diguanylate cyclase (GGDEF)-like protein
VTAGVRGSSSDLPGADGAEVDTSVSGQGTTAVGPRQPETAARIASWLCVVGAATTILLNYLVPPTAVPPWVPAVPAAIVGIFGLVLRWLPAAAKEGCCVAAPILAACCIAVMDILTHNASAGGQAFFVLPVLFAGSQLLPLGAAVATLVNVLAAAIVAFDLERAPQCFTDVGFVAASLVLVGFVLAHSARTQDRLTLRLEAQAGVDALTGLATRRVLDGAVQTALGRAASGRGVALILVDVDHFKAVNDEYGHPVGDDALVHVGQIVRSLARQDDVVARMGGDEIAVLLPGCDHVTAEERAELIVACVREAPLNLGGQALTLTVSAGAGHAPSQATDARGLFKAADVALYAAKRSGRGRARVTR